MIGESSDCLGDDNMNIAAISIEMNQPSVMKTGIEATEKDNNLMRQTINGLKDPNLGQNLDVIAGTQVDRDEELNKQIGIQVQQELKWTQDRQKMLNVKEVKMLQIREIEEQGKQLRSLTTQEQKKLNDRLNNLEAQVSAIDSDSRRTKDGKKLQ